jgi:hypothetical protein
LPTPLAPSGSKTGFVMPVGMGIGMPTAAVATRVVTVLRVAAFGTFAPSTLACVGPKSTYTSPPTAVRST